MQISLKAAAGRVVDAMVASITESLQKGDDVALVGFGTFTVRDRAARTGRNPQTGKKKFKLLLPKCLHSVRVKV